MLHADHFRNIYPSTPSHLGIPLQLARILLLNCNIRQGRLDTIMVDHN